MSVVAPAPAGWEQRAARAAVGWAADEGWNPGLDDEQRFLRADPEAFLCTERDGDVVATVSCARYGERYAFVGFFIVACAVRGQGIGRALFDRALAHAGDRVIGLDGVLGQRATYARRGFAAAHHNVRVRLAGGGARPAGLADLSDVPFERVLAYDAGVFGASRERFLRVWIDRPAGHALACVRGCRVAGYGVVRPCRAGWKIGPLFADDAGIAEALLQGLLAGAGAGGEVLVDLPEANPRARALAPEAEPVFETVRMYRGGRPPEDLARVFAVTSLELG
jgi:Acetyltransferase (GNAT) domain/Acetyltransferase (GNAT) family